MFDSDDLEEKIMKEEIPKVSSEQFPLLKLSLPNFQGKIVSMSSSKKYLYFITDLGELFRLKSGDLSSLNQAYRIRPESSKYPPFKEKLIKIWTDIAGNHSIIRYKNSVFYFNSECSVVKELKLFKEKQIEIFAVGFDETNQSVYKTGNILISDYNNNIYEYSITLDNLDRDDFSFHDKISFLDSLVYQDWDKEEEDEITKEVDSNNRIYGIKFYRTNFKPATKEKQQNKEKEQKSVINNCYIILVTKNKMFQLRGQIVDNSFKSLFDKYKKNHSLYNESCKYLPEGNKNKIDDNNFEINILNNSYNKFEKFGWKTQCGYLYGDFDYGSDYTPEDITKSTFITFTKITQEGKKIDDAPINIVHSLNHIFILYKDCLTIISKINTNIIHTQYLSKSFNNIFYNQFSEKNGNLILVSNNGDVYNIPLERENNYIWEDYLEIGNYDEAVNICEKMNPGLIKKIKKVSAEEYYERGRGYKAAKDFSFSDEKFETVCILFLMKSDYKNLKNYLTNYCNNNLDIKQNATQFMLVTFLLFNIYLKENKKTMKTIDLEDTPLNKENIELIEQNKASLANFSNFIKENKDFLNKEMFYQILKSSGRMEEYIEYSKIMQDYDKIILYYINEKNIPKALHELTQISNSTNKEETLKKLSNIFEQNAPILFKQSPKESIILLKEKFQKYVDMEIIIRAIVSMTDKDEFSIGFEGNPELEKIKIKSDFNEKEDNEKKEIKKSNDNEILDYLRNLIKKNTKNMKEERNVHNLYIYYLSKNEENQDELLEYLKSPLNHKVNMYSPSKNRGALFQLDYAKKLFRNNPEALALVLALMGKYSEGVNLALKTNTNKSKEIAKFIAANTQNEKLKKKLWIDIFCDNKQNEKDPIKIMKESKILKIEDVLPYISDEIKIEDFKAQISKSINEYEENINHLKEDINNYNKANEVIIDEIYKINKKSIELKYSECKCDFCHKIIKNKNLYLFPCGHMFDAICIKKCLKNYENEGVKMEKLVEKNKKIAELFKKLKINEESEKNNEETNEKKDIMGMGQIFSKIINYGKEVVNKAKETSSEKLTLKEVEEEQKKLNNLLSEQCVFCWEYLIENVQNSLIDEEKDAIEWAYA